MRCLGFPRLRRWGEGRVGRIISWFSCGAASAVATKLLLSEKPERFDVRVVYCETGSEHPDNERFLADCENWFGQSVL